MREKILTAAVFLALIALFVLAANDGKLPWAAAPAEDGDWCAEHDVAESECALCNPALARGGTFTACEREPREGECPNTLARVHLGPGAAERAGIALHTAELKPVPGILRANAETLHPPHRYARVAPRLPGVVREVKATLGQEVRAGEALAVLESVEFGQAKVDYLQALALVRLREKTFEQEKELFEKRIAAGRERIQAETQIEEARLAAKGAAQKLHVLGLPAEEVGEIAAGQDISPRIEVRAPFDGTVVEATAVTGDLAGPEKPLFSIAATDRLWIVIDAHEADLLRVRKGQTVRFSVEGLPGKDFTGTVVAVGGEVDDRTRTARVYAEIENADGLLRARMFGRAEITVKPPEPRLILPRGAVQNDGDCHLVFVSEAPDVFRARQVRLGAAEGDGFEIEDGLAPGEKVVSRGSFLLKSEILRGQMGAG